MKKFNFDKLDEMKGEMSYLEVSRQTGIPNQTIHNWKKGIYQPDIKNVLKLCDLFGLKVDDWYIEAEGGD